MHPLQAYLQASAKTYPDHSAVVDPDSNAVLSYRELDARSSAFAARLVDAGVRPGDRVGIYIPKSIASVVAIFGALKARAAYVPVDPLAPPSRSAFIFNDCSVRVAVVDRTLASEYETAARDYEWTSQSSGLRFEEAAMDVDLVGYQDEDRHTAVADAAYILYTSGSTGRPKGVVHTHASARSFVDWCSATFEPIADDRFSSHAPFHFDLSILDLYVPIKHGATIILIGEESGKQPLRLAEIIAGQKISMWYSTPSILRLLVEYGQLDRFDFGALRIVNFAGEVFPVKHLRALTKRWPHVRYYNLYGPTETNVCTFAEVPSRIPDDRTEPYPIGRVCSNDRARIVDLDEREVPPGTEGELYVAGGTVMHGYWNLPDRTATAFHTDSSGVRWYRTGDVVREDPSGNLIFIGRRDRMVKRRGYRVELGEIEAALYKHPAVQEAGVVALPDEENGVRIRAFLSWADGVRGSQIKLKQFAAANLPRYMIPDQFEFLSALPKTSTDKIDYQRLAEL